MDIVGNVCRRYARFISAPLKGVEVKMFYRIVPK